MFKTIKSMSVQLFTERARLAETIIKQLKNQIESLKQAAVADACRIDEERLKQENVALRQKLDALKVRMMIAEIKNGVKQVPLPVRNFSTSAAVAKEIKAEPANTSSESQANNKPAQNKGKGRAKAQEEEGKALADQDFERQEAVAGLLLLTVSHMESTQRNVYVHQINPYTSTDNTGNMPDDAVGPNPITEPQSIADSDTSIEDTANILDAAEDIIPVTKPQTIAYSDTSIEDTANILDAAEDIIPLTKLQTTANDEPPGKKGKTEKKDAVEAASEKMDVSRLDFRIGKVISVKKHPDADSLYVEEVDLGEGKTRTVVSGLVKHVPIEEMQDIIAVFMCNLKPVKMRGIFSEAMIMCANGPDRLEILVPPAGSQIGERVKAADYPGEPDAQLNPKKKIWETLKPDLRTDNNKVAVYKGSPLSVGDHGVVVAPTQANAQIA